MSTTTLNLVEGFPIGDRKLKKVTLRSNTTADHIECMELAEKMVMTEAGPELVASPSVMGMAMLARQIVKIDDHDGPLTIEELKKLEPVDFSLIQAESEVLAIADEKAASKAVAQRGRTDKPGR